MMTEDFVKEFPLARGLLKPAEECERYFELRHVVRDLADSTVPWENLTTAQRDSVAELEAWPQHKYPRPRPGLGCEKVCIVGKGPSQGQAPHGQEGWEIWGLNEAVLRRGVAPIEAFTRWFQLHPPKYLKKHHKRGLDDLDWQWKRERLWCEDTQVTLYMDRRYRAYPNSRAYPKEAVEALTPHGRYHTISFDWMIALAVLEGFKEIHLVGCNLYTTPVMNGESLSGRASVEYWCGVAEGRGAKVTVTGMNDLFRAVHVARRVSDLQYGWDHEPGHDLGDGWTDLR